jgi:hypothetical protein
MLFSNILHALRTEDGQVQFWGAFFAAMFSLFTLWIANTLSRLSKRRTKHYNALVLISNQLNQHMGQINDLVYSLRGFLATHKSGAVSFSGIPMPEVTTIKLMDDLLDLEIANALFSYNRDIDRLNHDLEMMSKAYAELRTGLLQGQYKPEEFFGMFPSMARDVEFFIRVWQRQIEKNIDLSAQVRLTSQRDKGVFTKVMLWYVQKRMRPLARRDIENEKRQLESEIEQISKDSRREIDELSQGLYGSKNSSR